MKNEIAKELQKRYDLKYILDHDYVLFDKKTGKQITSVPNVKIDYDSFQKDKAGRCNNMYDFWKINKNVAEALIGYSITDEEYVYDCCRNVAYLTDYVDCMMLYEEGVFCDGNRAYLSREAIKGTIRYLNKILDNYDEHFENVMNHQLDTFIDNCMMLKRRYNRSADIKTPTKKTPEVTENPTGYIYVMKNCGYYKIGKAQIGSSRFGEYTKLPEEPEYVIKTIVGNYHKVEAALHERYKDKRLRDGGCEWFELEDSDIEEIKDFVSQYAVEE